MKKSILIVIVLSLLTVSGFGKKVVVLPELVNPIRFDMDERQVYVPDGSSIFIYSLKDLSLVKKFGERGEGPQEFKLANYAGGDLLLDAHKDYLLVNSVGKLSYFKKDGTFIKEIKLPTMAYHLLACKESFVGFEFNLHDKLLYWFINLYNSRFGKIRELVKIQYYVQKGRKINPVYFASNPCYRHDDERIYVNNDDGEILVFDHMGKQVDLIKPQYEKVPVTKEIKKEIIDYFQRSRAFRQYFEAYKDRLQFSDFFPLVREFYVDGPYIFVVSYGGGKEGKDVYVVDKKSGKSLKKIVLPLTGNRSILGVYPYAIKSWKLYQLIDNAETEKWEFHITDLAKYKPKAQ